MNVSVEKSGEKIMKAIKEFTADLWRAFANKKERELGMYCRLINTTTPDDKERIKNFISGFQTFFLKYDNAIVEGRLETISIGEQILFGGNAKISVDIQRFIHKSDHASRESIRKHLLIISTLLNPSKDKVDALSKNMDEMGIDVSTKEGAFMSDLLQGVSQLGLDETSMNDPMTAFATMMSSGLLQKMFTGMKEGEFDIDNLASSMEGLIGKIPPEMRLKIHGVSNKISALTKPPQDVEEEDEDLDVD